MLVLEISFVRDPVGDPSGLVVSSSFDRDEKVEAVSDVSRSMVVGVAIRETSTSDAQLATGSVLVDEDGVSSAEGEDAV